MSIIRKIQGEKAVSALRLSQYLKTLEFERNYYREPSELRLHHQLEEGLRIVDEEGREARYSGFASPRKSAKMPVVVDEHLPTLYADTLLNADMERFSVRLEDVAGYLRVNYPLKTHFYWLDQEGHKLSLQVEKHTRAAYIGYLRGEALLMQRFNKPGLEITRGEIALWLSYGIIKAWNFEYAGAWPVEYDCWADVVRKDHHPGTASLEDCLIRLFFSQTELETVEPIERWLSFGQLVERWKTFSLATADVSAIIESGLVFYPLLIIQQHPAPLSPEEHKAIWAAGGDGPTMRQVRPYIPGAYFWLSTIQEYEKKHLLSLLDQDKPQAPPAPMGDQQPIDPSAFLSFHQAQKLLAERLNITEEDSGHEIAGRIFHQELRGYTNINECGDQRRFHFPDAALWVKRADFDSKPPYEYLLLLEKCYFKAGDMAEIGGNRRYVTGTALIDRWREYRKSESQTRAFITGRIEESRLLAFHPVYGGPDVEEILTKGKQDFPLPPIDQCLFCWDEVVAVEAVEFGPIIQANANPPKHRDRNPGSVAKESEAPSQNSPQNDQGETVKPLVYISKKAALERLQGIVKITPNKLENMLKNAKHNPRVKACMSPSGQGWCLALLIRYFADKGGILKGEFIGMFGDVDMEKALREVEKS